MNRITILRARRAWRTWGPLTIGALQLLAALAVVLNIARALT